MASLALALIATTAIANVADARRGRKCPKGYEDINGICVLDPTPGSDAAPSGRSAVTTDKDSMKCFLGGGGSMHCPQISILLG
jgi:hypothetical protein